MNLLTSVSGNCYNFTRTTAPNTGCRTFEFRFITCDCQQTQKVVDFTVTGQNITPPMPPRLPIPVIFPPDGGRCCDGYDHRLLQDEVTVTWNPNQANCLTYTLLNANKDCEPLNDFHFRVPSGCMPSSVTISPSGFLWTFNPAMDQIDIAPDPIQGAEIECCQEMVVTVCFVDCQGPFPSYQTIWSSTRNGNTITDSVQYIVLGGSGGPVPPPPPLKVQSGTSRLQDESNYPNPFGSASQFKTTIPFMTDGTGTAEITIMDATGKVVLTDDLVITDAGKHFFYFTAEELPAGSYYYTIESPIGAVIVKRSLIVVK